MVAEHRLDELLQRHAAFWRREPVNRPLLTVAPWQGYGFYPPFPLADGSPMPDGTELQPGLVGARRYLEHARPESLLEGDFLRPWTPWDGCWMEAMAGCRVVQSSGTTWAEAGAKEWDGAVALIRAGPAKGWLDEWVAVHRLLANLAGDERPAGQPLMRGPADMALAALGSRAFGEAFHDRPDDVDALLADCARLRREAACRRLEALRPFRGGWCGRDAWGLWAPGPLLDLQEDAAGLLSPAAYRRHVAPIDRALAAEYPFALMHVHSGQLQMLTAMLDIDELTAIQVAIDPPPYAAPARTLLPHFQAVQAAGKALLVTGPMTAAELDTMLGVLSPTGLALRVGMMGPSPAP